jgi:cytochrome c
MKKKTVFLLTILSSTLTFTFAVAKHHTPEDRGMTHFNNPEFAGGKRACNSCHPNGRGLEGAGAKSSFAIMGGKQGNLEEAVNVCVVNANKGNAIGIDSAEMQEMVSYIKSLGK